MVKFKVTVIGLDVPFIPTWVNKIMDEQGIEFIPYQCATREELEEYAHDADIVWVWGGSNCMKTENLSVLKRCRCIIRTGSGTDNIPVAEATDMGIVVANTPEAINETVAVHTIGLLFSVIRYIPLHNHLVRQGIWDRERGWSQWHLKGQTLGLVGFGRIAQMVASKMSGFEINIVAYDPYVSDQQMNELNVKKFELDELLSQSDFISIHCPLTKETRHIIGERTLKIMNSNAVLINAGRGPLIDEKALYRALSEKWISAAAVDVMEKEPPDPDHPLLKLDNFIVTPHVAPYSDTYWDDMWGYSVENNMLRDTH